MQFVSCFVTVDGYRKEEKDLIMNKEQTIYDLNQKKELNK